MSVMKGRLRGLTLKAGPDTGNARRNFKQQKPWSNHTKATTADLGKNISDGAHFCVYLILRFLDGRI